MATVSVEKQGRGYVAKVSAPSVKAAKQTAADEGWLNYGPVTSYREMVLVRDAAHDHAAVYDPGGKTWIDMSLAQADRLFADYH